MRDRQSSARRAQRFLNFLADRVWFYIRANRPGNWNDAVVERCDSIGYLGHRDVHNGIRVVVEPLTTHVAYDPNNLAPRLSTLRPTSLANRAPLPTRIAICHK